MSQLFHFSQCIFRVTQLFHVPCSVHFKSFIYSTLLLFSPNNLVSFYLGLEQNFCITMLASFEVEIKKSWLTISILPGILKFKIKEIKWGYSGQYSDNLDVI